MAANNQKSIGLRIDGLIFKKDNGNILYLHELQQLLEKEGLELTGHVHWVDEDGNPLEVTFY